MTTVQMAFSPLSTEPSQNCDCPSLVWLRVCVCVCGHALSKDVEIERKTIYTVEKSGGLKCVCCTLWKDQLWWSDILWLPVCQVQRKPDTGPTHQQTLRQTKIKALPWCRVMFFHPSKMLQLENFSLLLLDYQYHTGAALTPVQPLTLSELTHLVV